jgi:hypothetical protein
MNNKFIIGNFAFCALALLLTQSASSDELNIAPFTANYSVEYRGIRAGNLDFILRKNGGRFVYESIAHPRGLARIVINNNLREATEFTFENGTIKPQKYELDDGSSDTADDTRLTMDWNIGKASGMHEDHAIELPLAPGVQDRMSAQVVVMQLLATGKQPDKITFIDRNELKEYTYTRVREEPLKTMIGTLNTVVYTSTRPGSSRISRLWYAPSLGFVPVRGEQERKGKVETVFEIQKLDKSKG